MKTLCILFAALIPALCSGDEIQLINGAKITGTIAPPSVQVITPRGIVTLPLSQIAPASLGQLPQAKAEDALLGEIKKLKAENAALAYQLAQMKPKPAAAFETKDGEIFTRQTASKDPRTVKFEKYANISGTPTTVEMTLSEYAIDFETKKGSGDTFNHMNIYVLDDEVPEFLTILQKYAEWEPIARAQNMEPFSKRIGTILGDKVDFEWIELSGRKCGELLRFRKPESKSYNEITAADARLTASFLGDMRVPRAELAKAIAKDDEQKKVFK